MFITGGRRGKVNLSSILKFVTGTENEPLLGFKMHPSFFYQDQQEQLFAVQ